MTRHAHNFKDITGQRFGRVEVLRWEPSMDGAGGYWKCRCDCGVEFRTSGSNLRLGKTRSCGCLRSEVTADLGRHFIGGAHGCKPVTVCHRKHGELTLRSGNQAAAFLRCSPRTIFNHIESGKPFNGYTIKFYQSNDPV